MAPGSTTPNRSSNGSTTRREGSAAAALVELARLLARQAAREFIASDPTPQSDSTEAASNGATGRELTSKIDARKKGRNHA